MRTRKSVLALSCLGLILIAVLVPALALAQSDDNRGSALLAGGMLMVVFVIGLAFYAYFCLALYTIANKTHTENAWMAWIPIVHYFLMVNIAKKPAWWFLLFLVPFVNLVIAVIVWMAIAEVRGKPSWWGIMMIVPLMNLITPGYLAWAD